MKDDHTEKKSAAEVVGIKPMPYVFSTIPHHTTVAIIDIFLVPRARASWSRRPFFAGEEMFLLSTFFLSRDVLWAISANSK